MKNSLDKIDKTNYLMSEFLENSRYMAVIIIEGPVITCSKNIHM